MNSIRVLITGGAGFIGVNLTRHLLAKGDYDVYVLDNFSNSIREYLPDDSKLTVYQDDLSNSKNLPRYLQDKDYVVHLAAHTYVRESIEYPSHNFQENAVVTFHLLNASAKAGVKHFIFASTGAVIGNHPPPIHEELVARPISPYGASKLVGEAYCNVFSEISDMKCTILRFSNIYGPYSIKKTSVVAKFIKLVMNSYCIEIYGDGSQTRDYLYVEDLCDLVVKTFGCDYKSNLFQVASGEGTSLNALINLLEENFNKKIDKKYLGFNKGEVKYNYAKVSKAEKVLKFYPRVSLEIGIKKTIGWFLKCK
tara:strand:- start:3143 stop:4069 length:927 start_codon:yes stop_codon:yes gene_type:complete